jgi:predicted DsbA family dithiol-disulfide isomerase/Skp family chaperone for outer membrane proteins
MLKAKGTLVCVILAVAALGAAPAAPTPAAVVNGEVVTEAQVEAAAAANLKTLEAAHPHSERTAPRERLAILHRALDAIVEDKLLTAEAAKLNTTKQEILDAEIDSNVSIPTDEEVAAYYEKNKARFSAPRDQALHQITQLLIDQSRQPYHDALFNRLKRTYGYREFLEPIRTEVATAGYPSRGPAGAPVTIVEFSDFECPFCGGLYPTLKTIEAAYPDTVRLVYRQFPLRNIHPHAEKAAEASLCANEQGHFWDMHDSMFGNQQQLTVAALKKRAADLKLDAAAFDACLDSGRETAAIDKDMAEGAGAGVTGTPTMFINGRFLPGNRPYADIKNLIDDELQRRAPARSK